MRPLTIPNPQQEAAVRERALQLRAVYARFPKIATQSPKPSAGQYLKGLFSFTLQNPPAEFDWRDHIQIPQAKDQGDCNSCTSFAASATIEIASLISNGGAAPDVAAQHMHTCIANADSGDPSDICSFGIEPRRLLKSLEEIGYAVSLPDTDPFPPASCPMVATDAKLQNFSAVTPSAARLRLTKGPILTDMYIWNDFFDYTTSRSPIYVPDMTQGDSRLHSVCVIGYSPEGWIIKNSFGSDWGDGAGFATIQKGACGLLTDTPPPGEQPRPAYWIEVS